MFRFLNTHLSLLVATKIILFADVPIHTIFYPARMGRRGFPGSMLSMLLALFVVSLVTLLGWLGYFAFDATFFGRPGALGGLWLTAVLSGSVAFFSGLLAFYYSHEDYAQGEGVFFGVFLVVSAGILLCSGIWAVLTSLFG